MAKRTTTPPTGDTPQESTERVVDIDVEDEMRDAFLEYSYSVIYSRALPDARDGLKPVQRRILFGMSELGLRPDRPHVKCSRVVGEVMGKYHPHGDQAIYDAMVRMAQPFTMRLPLVDGHGNFGSLDDGPAASRYTEARMAPAALLMVSGLDEDTVDYVPNYDDSLLQPGVLPAAYPNLLVNGASGIAVGMATNMAPHNLVEVIGAARHLITHPDCSLDDLMRFVPGPDLPGGGRIVGLDGIRDAYLTGRGSFRTRATARVEKLTPRRMGIVVTELPYLVGPEKVIERVKTLVQAKKLQGISDVKDLTDRKHGLRLVFEVKNGFNPDAVLEQLYKLTPMEDSFGINNVALVDGQPRTLGLKELLRTYVDFRIGVVRRRTEHRLRKRRDRLHLVEGLLVAIVDIDEVIQLIRTSDDAATAKSRLISVFDLSDAQADYILELQLRRLTKFSLIELETERDELRRQIEELEAILADEKLLHRTVSSELADVAKAHGTPRRTVLLESAGVPASVGTPLEVADDPCWVLLSSTGLLARTSSADPVPSEGGRAKHDAIIGAVRTTARGEFALLTSAGRMLRMSALELPTLPPLGGAPSLSGGAPLGLFADLPAGEEPLTIVGLDAEGPGIALGTAQGVVKRVTPEHPSRPHWEVISPQGGRPRRRGDRAARRRGGPRLRHERRAAAALPGLVGSAPGARGRRDVRHPPLPRGVRRVLRRGRPRFGCRRRHLLGQRRRPARHPARGDQGHALRRVPRQGAGHGWRARTPVPARGGRPRPGVGRGAARSGQRCGRCRPRAPGGVRQARRLRHGLPVGHRRNRRPGALTDRGATRRSRSLTSAWTSPVAPWLPPCYAIVTGATRGTVALTA